MPEQHTPWRIGDTIRESGHVKIVGAGFVGLIATVGNGEHAPDRYARIAALIVRAGNRDHHFDALVKALETARLMIRGEIIEGAVVDFESMQSLGDALDAALASIQEGK